MIILRAKNFTAATVFKPKFRNRFRSGDFSYVQAKDPKNEAANHQAYKEVAEEPEFRNNPETYKIRQGMFSELEERRYAIIPDMIKYRKSGIKRVWAKNIGNLRRRAAKLIEQKKIQPARKLLEESGKEVLQSNGLNNPKLLREMMEEGKARGAQTVSTLDNLGTIGSFNSRSSILLSPQASTLSLSKKAKNAAKNNKFVIFHDTGVYDLSSMWPQQAGKSAKAEYLAHEVGHVDNAVSRNPIKKFINWAGGSSPARVEVNNGVYINGKDSATGLRPAFSRLLNNSYIVAEESGATRTGLRLLRRHGATQKEIEEAKKSLGHGINTYKASRSIGFWNPVENMVNIPSRRRV